MIVSTTENGFKIKENKGIVKGVSIYSEKYFETIKTIIKSKRGGILENFAELLNQSIEHATSDMLAKAELVGANAVIGVRINTEVLISSGNDNITAVTVYGTAVVCGE